MLLKGKTILFVRIGGNGRLHAYREVKKTGIKLICVAPVKFDWALEVVDEWIVSETYDFTVLNKAVQGYLQANPTVKFDGVMSFDEYGVIPATKLASVLHCPAVPASTSAVEATSCKDRFRALCSKHGLFSPGVASVFDPQDISEVTKQRLTYPLVLKPSQGAGSMCVQLAENESALKEAVTTTLSSIGKSTDVNHWTQAQSVHVLCEEFIEGDELDVDVLVQDNKVLFAGISDNFACELPYFFEEGGLAPSVQPVEVKQAIVKLVEDFFKMHTDEDGSVKWNGALHVEVKLHPTKGPVLIEVNCRLGGAETWTLVNGAWNTDMAVSVVSIAVGVTPTIGHEIQGKYYISNNMRPRNAGKLVKQIVPKSVEEDPNFVRLTMYYDVGTYMFVPPQRYMYYGWMVAVGETPEKAKDNLKRLEGQIHWELDETATPPEI